jgi:hypothetical protein
MPLSPDVQKAAVAAMAAIAPLATLPIDHPPCAKCKNWNPKVVSTNPGVAPVVVLCHSEMKRDFSCFQPRS